MKRVKVISGVIILCIFASLIVGCEKNNNNKDVVNNKKNKKTSISEERKKATVKLNKDIVVAADNCKLTTSNSNGGNQFEFYIMTKEIVEENDIKVIMDTDVKYSVHIYDMSEFETMTNGDVYISDITTFSYNKIDWNKCLELENNGSTEELELYKNKYNNGYTGVIDCYFYKVSVIFDHDEIKKIKDNSEINKMYIEYKGEKIEKEISVKFIKDLWDLSRPFSKAMTGLGESKVFRQCVEPNKDGKLPSYNESFKADKNFVIKEIKCVSDNGIEVENVDVTGSVNNNISQKKQGEIEVKKGDTVYLSIKLRDKESSNQLTYSKNAIISMKYQVEGVDGIDEEQYSISFCSSAMLDEIYAYYVDNVDIMKYYNEYHNIGKGLS